MPPRLRAAFALLSITPKAAVRPARPAGLAVVRGQQQQQQRCASILSALSDNKGAYNKKIRRGRGPASGKGKTGGRGQKGQHAHGKVPAGFQGGQTPESITRPERGRGVYNPFKVEMSPINLDRIQAWIDQGRLDASQPITMTELHRSRCLHGVKRHGVKLLARNPEKLTSAINIVVSRASAEAIARVESLGGTVTTRFYSPTSIKRVLRGDSHPTLSLQSPPSLVTLASTARARPIPSPILSALQTAPEEGKKAALLAVIKHVSQQYKYRLPDPTARKDIEYYRDPAHRGYLAHLLSEGESPSLFFKPPGEVKDRKKQSARRDAAKASADNRLF